MKEQHWHKTQEMSRIVCVRVWINLVGSMKGGRWKGARLWENEQRGGVCRSVDSFLSVGPFPSHSLARSIIVALTRSHSFHTFLCGSSPFHPGSVCLRPSSLRLILLLFSHLHSAPLCAVCSLSGCRLLFHLSFSRSAVSPFSCRCLFEICWNIYI